MTPASPTTGTVVAAQGLTRCFGADKAVDGVGLTVASGEIHALVGLNGAGKTTVMKLLLGMLCPDAGSVLLFGEPVVDAGPQAWSRVGHLLETPFGYSELTPTENVITAARLHGMDVAAARRQAAEIIGELTLDRWADRRSRVLSLGNRQRLGLACALVHRPRVLILDEPTNGLDPLGVLELRRMLLSRSHGDGVGVLVSSHHLDESRQDRRPDHRDAPRPGHRRPGRWRRRSGTPVPPAGLQVTIDESIDTRATGRRSVAGPTPTPATGAPPAPGTPSAGDPAATSSPTTPPATAASRSSPTTDTSPTRTRSTPTGTSPTSNAATICSRASRTPTRSGYATQPASKRSSAASSSPCSSAPSSNARSAQP